MYYVMVYAAFEGWTTMYRFRNRKDALAKAKEIAPDVENVMVVQLVIDGEALRVHEVCK